MIRKSSLLGRYYEFLCEIPPRKYWKWDRLDLCTFMRRLVFRSLWGITIVSAGLLLVAALVYVPYWHMTHGWTAPRELPSTPETILYAVGFLELLLASGLAWIGVIILFAAIILTAFERTRAWRERGVLTAWLAAKKAKVCPMVEVAD